MDRYGIYIHIPFCVRKCPYCDFYSLSGDVDLRREYLSALSNQILSFPPVEADTVYFGGGTPSLLEPEEIASLMEAVRSRHRLEPDSEVSMECNPATAGPDKLRGFLDAGVNRLSVGCQSFDDGTLKRLGRLHDAGQAALTVSQAKQAGFSSVSVDLMLAVPGQTPEKAASDAAAAAALGADHVSAYLLKINEGTPFADGVEGLPDDDTAAACYLACCDRLRAEGYGRYEISNFARPGHQSRHNLKYWRCGRWLGLGPAAHMSDGTKRYSYPPDIRRFIRDFRDGTVGDPLSLMDFEGTVDAEEFIIMSARLEEGLELGGLKRRYGTDLLKEKGAFLERLEREGLILLRDGRLRFTDRGILVSNSILSELI